MCIATLLFVICLQFRCCCRCHCLYPACAPSVVDDVHVCVAVVVVVVEAVSAICGGGGGFVVVVRFVDVADFGVFLVDVAMFV